MPSREEMIAFLKAKQQAAQGQPDDASGNEAPAPSGTPAPDAAAQPAMTPREQKIAFLKDVAVNGPPAKAPEPEGWGKQLVRNTVDTVLPWGGMAAAGLAATPETLGALTIPAAAAGYAGGKQAARMVNHYLLGDDAGAKTAGGLAMQTAKDFGVGSIASVAGNKAGEFVNAAVDEATPYVAPVLDKAGKLIQPVTDYVAAPFKSVARKAVLNATGATGKQVSQFAPGAADELLDNGLVKFGDTQADIAKRLANHSSVAENKISDSLATLEKNGVNVNGDDLASGIESKINSLKADPSKAGIVKQLQGELDNINNALVAKAQIAKKSVSDQIAELSKDPANGDQVAQLQKQLEQMPDKANSFGINEAEQIKRGYRKAAGNWADQTAGQTGKEMYQTFRGAVEDSANAADPDTAKVFEDGKKTYGISAPIQEAAERRAATTSQSPYGGLADISALGAGFMHGGPMGIAMGIAAPIGRRVIAPRIASSTAALANGAAEAISGIPQMLMKSPELAQLATKNPSAFNELVERVGSHFGNNVEAAALPAAAKNQAPNELDRDSSKSAQYQAPKTGPAAWAANGLAKINQHDQTLGLSQSDIQDPKVKDLVIQASDLKPGSKAMESLASKIRAIKAKGGN